jgi:very-short-patch-repair endonuclease
VVRLVRMKIFNNKIEKGKRRQLGKAMVPSEVRVWSRIRTKQLGFKFRRQFSVGAYVLDLYCPEVKLAIEIDGDTHSGESSESADRNRQQFIESFSIRFLRFTNSQVYENLDAVIEQIVVTAKKLQETSPNPSFKRRGFEAINSSDSSPLKGRSGGVFGHSHEIK